MRLHLLLWWALEWDVVIGSTTSSRYSFFTDDLDYNSVDFPDCSGVPSHFGDGECASHNNNEVRVVSIAIMECVVLVNG